MDSALVCLPATNFKINIMSKFYISLPISNKDEATQRRHAIRIKNQIELNGHDAVNPFDLYDELCLIHRHCKKPKPTYEEIILEDIAALTDCNAIVLCVEWILSKGCNKEYNHAKELNLVIVDECELWKYIA